MYILVCLLRGEIEAYRQSLIDSVYTIYGLNVVKNQNAPAHFTLKYEFDVENIGKLSEIETFCEYFCKTHQKSQVRIGGFLSFPPSVVFIDVKPSEEAQKAFSDFIIGLRTMKWMQWGAYDAENLRFHATIAEGCGNLFNVVWKFVQGKEKYFDVWFDNIAILNVEWSGGELIRWNFHKIFEME